VGLLDRLVPIVPPALSRFFFANSGSEAVDQAVKIARGHTGKQNIICFEVGASLILV
jgi:4-aminobutyrate aminotransferase